MSHAFFRLERRVLKVVKNDKARHDSNRDQISLLSTIDEDSSNMFVLEHFAFDAKSFRHERFGSVFNAPRSYHVFTPQNCSRTIDSTSNQSRPQIISRMYIRRVKFCRPETEVRLKTTRHETASSRAVLIESRPSAKYHHRRHGTSTKVQLINSQLRVVRETTNVLRLENELFVSNTERHCENVVLRIVLVTRSSCCAQH